MLKRMLCEGVVSMVALSLEKLRYCETVDSVEFFAAIVPDIDGTNKTEVASTLKVS